MSGGGANLDPSRFLLNIVPVFNVPTGPGATDATGQNTTAITAIKTVVNYQTYTGYFNTLSSYNQGQILVSDPLYVVTSFAVGQQGNTSGFVCDINGNFNVNGNIQYSGTLTMSSDLRLKKDVRNLNAIMCLQSVLSLQGVNFTWRNNDEYDIGFIAQEVDKYIPSAVSEGVDGLLKLKPLALIPYLVESIKVLHARIAALERAIPE
jgi:hypothetical protein